MLERDPGKSNVSTELGDSLNIDERFSWYLPVDAPCPAPPSYLPNPILGFIQAYRKLTTNNFFESPN